MGVEGWGWGGFTTAAPQPGSNKLHRSSVIAQVDVLRVVFNRLVWRLKPPSPPLPLVVMLKVNKSPSGPNDSIH